MKKKTGLEKLYSRFDLERAFAAGWEQGDFEDWFKNFTTNPAGIKISENEGWSYKCLVCGCEHDEPQKDREQILQEQIGFSPLMDKMIHEIAKYRSVPDSVVKQELLDLKKPDCKGDHDWESVEPGYTGEAFRCKKCGIYD